MHVRLHLIISSLIASSSSRCFFRQCFMIFDNRVKCLFTRLTDGRHETNLECLRVYLQALNAEFEFILNDIRSLPEPAYQHEFLGDNSFVEVLVFVLLDEHLGVCCILPRDASCSKDHTCDDSLEKWRVEHIVDRFWIHIIPKRTSNDKCRYRPVECLDQRDHIASVEFHVVE